MPADAFEHARQQRVVRLRVRALDRGRRQEIDGKLRIRVAVVAEHRHDGIDPSAVGVVVGAEMFVANVARPGMRRGIAAGDRRRRQRESGCEDRSRDQQARDAQSPSAATCAATDSRSAVRL